MVRCFRGGGAELEPCRACVSGGGGGSVDVDCRQGTLVLAAPVGKPVKRVIPQLVRLCSKCVGGNGENIKEITIQNIYMYIYKVSLIV